MKEIILDSIKVQQTIKRLAYEVYEQSYLETELHLLGINNNGMELGRKLLVHLKNISPQTIHLHQLSIDPRKPLGEVRLGIAPKTLSSKHIIIVDDVANTGRTLFYSCKPILDILPKKIEFAVLVDRKHKNYPVKVDFVGLSLATTLKENIIVKFDKNSTEVYFD